MFLSCAEMEGSTTHLFAWRKVHKEKTMTRQAAVHMGILQYFPNFSVNLKLLYICS